MNKTTNFWFSFEKSPQNPVVKCKQSRRNWIVAPELAFKKQPPHHRTTVSYIRRTARLLLLEVALTLVCFCAIIYLICCWNLSFCLFSLYFFFFCCHHIWVIQIYIYIFFVLFIFFLTAYLFGLTFCGSVPRIASILYCNWQLFLLLPVLFVCVFFCCIYFGLFLPIACLLFGFGLMFWHFCNYFSHKMWF